jgi:hypothetical protein
VTEVVAKINRSREEMGSETFINNFEAVSLAIAHNQDLCTA